MKRDIIIATMNVDSDGDRIMPGALKMPGKPVIIFREFNYQAPLGMVNGIEEINGEYKAAVDITSEMIDNLYPAIGFELIKYHMDGEIRVIDELKLHAVGLSIHPNVDTSIKTIGEQNSDNVAKGKWNSPDWFEATG